jgi:hypothetical protein
MSMMCVCQYNSERGNIAMEYLAVTRNLFAFFSMT